MGVCLVCAKHLLLAAGGKHLMVCSWYSSHSMVEGELVLESRSSRLESQLSHSFTSNNLLNLAELPRFKTKPVMPLYRVVTGIDKRLVLYSA